MHHFGQSKEEECDGQRYDCTVQKSMVVRDAEHAIKRYINFPQYGYMIQEILEWARNREICESKMTIGSALAKEQKHGQN